MFFCFFGEKNVKKREEYREDNREETIISRFKNNNILNPHKRREKQRQMQFSSMKSLFLCYPKTRMWLWQMRKQWQWMQNNGKDFIFSYLPEGLESRRHGWSEWKGRSRCEWNGWRSRMVKRRKWAGCPCDVVVIMRYFIIHHMIKI